MGAVILKLALEIKLGFTVQKVDHMRGQYEMYGVGSPLREIDRVQSR